MARPSRYGGYSSDSEDPDFQTAYTSSRSSQPSSASHFSAPSSRSSIPSTSSHRTESSRPSHGSAQSYSSRHSSQHTNQDARLGRLQLFEERAGTVGKIAKTAGGIATATGLAYTVYHSYKKKKGKAFKSTYERQNSEVDLRLKEKGGHQKLWYDRQISEVDLLVKERDLTPDERRRLARRNKVEEPWRPSRGVGGSQVYSRYSAEESPMRQTEDNVVRRDHYGGPWSRIQQSSVQGDTRLQRSEYYSDSSPERVRSIYPGGDRARDPRHSSTGAYRRGRKHYDDGPVPPRRSFQIPAQSEDTSTRPSYYPEGQTQPQTTKWDRNPPRVHSRGRDSLPYSENVEIRKYSEKTFSGSSRRPIKSYRYRHRSSSRSRHGRIEVQSDSESESSLDERRPRSGGLPGLLRKLSLKSLRGTSDRDARGDSEFWERRGIGRRDEKRRHGSRSRSNSLKW